MQDAFAGVPSGQEMRDPADEHPRTDLAGEAVGSGLARQTGSMSQHILVVDDEAQIRELLCIYLIKQGYKVSTAGTTEETLKALKTGPVDLVVLDIGLADEDGLKLLAAIKKDYPGLRVVMLTGMGFVEDLLQEAHQKGADGYVSKVLPLDELLMAIQRTFKPAQVQLQSA